MEADLLPLTDPVKALWRQRRLKLALYAQLRYD